MMYIHDAVVLILHDVVVLILHDAVVFLILLDCYDVTRLFLYNYT